MPNGALFMAASSQGFFSSPHINNEALSDVHHTLHVNKNQPIKIVEPFRFDNQLSIKDRLSIRRQKALSANIAIERLRHIDFRTFDSLNPTNRRIQTEQLERIFQTLCDDFQLNSQTTENIEQLERCGRLLIRLRKQPYSHQKQDPQAILTDYVNESEKPAKYVALRILAPWIADRMVHRDSTLVNTMQYAIDTADIINAERLNWAWSGGLDTAIMGMLNHHVGHMGYANESFASFSIGTTYMGFILGYFRLGLHLSLLIRNTLKGSWMDSSRTSVDIAQNISLSERFRTQWQLRKFAIISDTLWATANLVCFMFLIGSNVLLYSGGALSSALMFVDVGLAIWEYFEQETDHHALQEQYKKDIQALNLEIFNFERKKQVLQEQIEDITQQIIKLRQSNQQFEPLTSVDLSNDSIALTIIKQSQTEQLLCFNLAQLQSQYNNMNVEVLKARRHELQEEQKQCERNWDHIHSNLYNNLIYSIILALSFGIISCAILATPLGITTANALLLNLIGSAIACAATIAIHAQTTSTEIEKSQALIAQEIDVAHHQELIAYHQGAMTYKAISDVLIPAAVLSCLIFAPSGLSLPILIPLVVVLFCIEAYIGHCKPQVASMPEIALDNDFSSSLQI